MDQPGIDVGEHEDALRGLGRINRLSLSASILWPAIEERVKGRPDGGTRVLDLATGGGDVPINLARRALLAGMEVRIEACDISPVAVSFASQAAEDARVPVRFFRLDALNEALPEDYDIVMCSLFLHHLADDEAIGLLRKMAGAARAMILVNDLRRSALGYSLAWIGCRMLSRSAIVHNDGPASVRSAFGLSEVRSLADRAGLQGARLVRRWPQRFLLSWSRVRS